MSRGCSQHFAQRHAMQGQFSLVMKRRFIQGSYVGKLQTRPVPQFTRAVHLHWHSSLSLSSTALDQTRLLQPRFERVSAGFTQWKNFSFDQSPSQPPRLLTNSLESSTAADTSSGTCGRKDTSGGFTSMSM